MTDGNRQPLQFSTLANKAVVGDFLGSRLRRLLEIGPVIVFIPGAAPQIRRAARNSPVSLRDGAT
jgi:hypothetical protein